MTRVLRFPALPVLLRMFALLALAGLLALPALQARAADDPAKAASKDKFEEMDKNKDGKVILEEFQASFPNMKESAFVVIDKNGDGAIDRVEWDEFLKGHAAGMKPGMGGMPPRMGAPMNNMPGDPMIPSPEILSISLYFAVSASVRKKSFFSLRRCALYATAASHCLLHSSSSMAETISP